MATAFKHKVTTSIGTTPTEILQMGLGFKATVIGFNVANVTEHDIVTINVWVIDSSSTAAYYIKNIIIPPNTSLKLITNGEKVILDDMTSLRITSDTENSIDVIVSYVEVTTV